MDDGVGGGGRDPAPAPLRFGPDRRATLLTAAGAVALGVLAARADPAGRLLLGAAALVLTGYTLTDLLGSPRLAVTATGLAVRTPTGRRTVPWARLDRVRATATTRWGLRQTTLEIETGDLLVVLSRRALGADPDRVAALIRHRDPRRGAPPPQAG